MTEPSVNLSAEDVARTLRAKKSGAGWTARCPAHDDKSPSLSISADWDGRPLVHCHAGCDQKVVWNAVKEACAPEKSEHRSTLVAGRKIVNPIPTDAPSVPSHPQLGPPTDRYRYSDEHGRTIGYQARWDLQDGKKELRPQTLWRSATGVLEWRFEGMAEPRPLYNLHELAKRPDAQVLLVEGEKAANAASKIFPDMAVTTWQNGANGLSKADWTPLAGRAVCIWPDADEPGRKAAGGAAEALLSIGASVDIVDLPPTLPKGWDLADDLEALGIEPRTLIEQAEAPSDTTLARFVISAPALLALNVPKREMIIEPWLPKAGLAMIFAKRGVGKTYLTMSLAASIAAGHQKFLGHYPISNPRRVLYIDGELPLAELQTRLARLCHPASANLMLLSSEQLFRAGVRLNVHEELCQRQIDTALKRLEQTNRRPDLIIIDSLSTLSSGVDENDNTALDILIRWLMELRHQGYSVLLVHHAGKSGDQRGASRREDYLDTSIKLEAPGSDIPHAGAHFKLIFSKVRGPYPQPHELDCKLAPGPDGRLAWTVSNAPSKIPAHIVTLRAIFEHKPGNQNQLAGLLGVSKAGISQHCKKLRANSEIHERGLEITLTGKTTLARHYSDLQHLLQREMPF